MVEVRTNFLELISATYWCFLDIGRLDVHPRTGEIVFDMLGEQLSWDSYPRCALNISQATSTASPPPKVLRPPSEPTQSSLVSRMIRTRTFHQLATFLPSGQTRVLGWRTSGLSHGEGVQNQVFDSMLGMSRW